MTGYVLLFTHQTVTLLLVLMVDVYIIQMRMLRLRTNLLHMSFCIMKLYCKQLLSKIKDAKFEICTVI